MLLLYFQGDVFYLTWGCGSGSFHPVCENEIWIGTFFEVVWAIWSASLSGMNVRALAQRLWTTRSFSSCSPGFYDQNNRVVMKRGLFINKLQAHTWSETRNGAELHASAMDLESGFAAPWVDSAPSLCGRSCLHRARGRIHFWLDCSVKIRENRSWNVLFTLLPRWWLRLPATASWCWSIYILCSISCSLQLIIQPQRPKNPCGKFAMGTYFSVAHFGDSNWSKLGLHTQQKIRDFSLRAGGNTHCGWKWALGAWSLLPHASISSNFGAQRRTCLFWSRVPITLNYRKNQKTFFFFKIAFIIYLAYSGFTEKMMKKISWEVRLVWILNENILFVA